MTPLGVFSFVALMIYPEFCPIYWANSSIGNAFNTVAPINRVRHLKNSLSKNNMEMIVNKVAESGIMTLDLIPYIPENDEIASFDLKPFLFREMILREKDYRAALQTHEWEQYRRKHVALFCSADAIIPVWAYMLAATYLNPVADSIYYGTTNELMNMLIMQKIQNIDVAEYAGKRVVIKGCGDTKIPDSAYVAITQHLVGVVRSLMYGEPCSTVPVYKKALKAE